MRRNSSILLAALAALGCGGVASGASQVQYRVTILNPSGSGNSIDGLGFVAGSYTPAAGAALHAVVWALGTQTDLGTLGAPSLNSTVQWPVKNSLGLVSGFSLTDAADPNKEGWSCSAFLPNPNLQQCLGFVWDPLTRHMRPLPPLPGGTNSLATGTNNLGETAGWAENGVHDPSCIAPQLLQFRPVVWGPGRGQLRELPVLELDSSGAPTGDTTGAATALNDRGQIVGISGACGFAVGSVSARHAVLWDNGRVIELANPNGALYWNTPMMINESGDVVGFAGAPNDPPGNFTPPFIWSARAGWRWIPLPLISVAGGAPQRDIAGVATSINSHRQVVGYSNDAVPNFHAWIWEDGVTQNLNDLVEPGSALQGALELAFDINDRGEITGATTSGQAFLAVPVRSGD
jgi:probable HAF family extracellular repeat protein